MAIELSNMLFCYPNQPNNPVLHIPNWSITNGEHVFLYGSSGRGKSTLLNLICGLLLPTKGIITVCGQRINEMSNRQRDRFRANHMGYVFQQFNLIPYLDAVDNIRLAQQFALTKTPTAALSNIESMLNKLGIDQHNRHKPTHLLSVGQQQRVAIARALINKPPVLIADEPTSSLDAQNTQTFMALLMDVVSEQSITLLFVSHDRSLFSHFSRVEALEDINTSKKTIALDHFDAKNHDKKKRKSAVYIE